MMKLRVKAYKTNGDKIQHLQLNFLGFWLTIDTEIVPAFVDIYQGCYGDTGGWKSKFSCFGTFGKDGDFAISELIKNYEKNGAEKEGTHMQWEFMKR